MYKNLKSSIVAVFLNSLVSFGREKQKGLIYILRATEQVGIPFDEMPLEQYAFIMNNCTYQNCYMTEDWSYLDDETLYDAVIFNEYTISKEAIEIPPKRSPKQIYILCSLESSANYPIKSNYNDFFNWTWTYKLNSDIPVPYITVRDEFGAVVGPGVDMHWIKFTKPISKYIRNKLRHKSIAAAWFVSHCDAQSNRSVYVNFLNKELEKYGHHVDIYGTCGFKNCPQSWNQECHALLETDYFFYLAFENSFGVDYVTEKVVSALEHFAVPIVYGGADYSRFLPDGTYLDANKLLPQKMAKKMNELIHNRDRYYDYFRWHGHYSFHNSEESNDTNLFCKLCAALNQNKLNQMKNLNETKVYHDIVRWFNEPKDWPENVPKKKPEQNRDDILYSKLYNVASDLYSYFFSDR